jgi:hypothetical protein
VALATAMLAPKPTPSAPAPTAVPMMILPSRDFNVPASSRWVTVLDPRTPTLAAAGLQRRSARGMKPAQRAGRGTVKTSWACWVVIKPIPVMEAFEGPDGASAVSW